MQDGLYVLVIKYKHLILPLRHYHVMCRTMWYCADMLKSDNIFSVSNRTFIYTNWSINFNVLHICCTVYESFYNHLQTLRNNKDFIWGMAMSISLLIFNRYVTPLRTCVCWLKELWTIFNNIRQDLRFKRYNARTNTLIY